MGMDFPISDLQLQRHQMEMDFQILGKLQQRFRPVLQVRMAQIMLEGTSSVSLGDTIQCL